MNTMSLQPIRTMKTIGTLFGMMLLLAGCSVQYVSRYDATTEQSITDIQRGVEALLQRVDRSIGTPEADYANFVQEYERLQIDAAMLNARAQAISQNSITAEQSAQLMGWLANLEQLHQTGFTSSELLAVPRRMGEQIFVAMLKFELAKKRQFDSALIDQE